MEIINKFKLYLILHFSLQLVTSILIVILLRCIFLYDTVHADSIATSDNKVDDHNFVYRHLYKIVFGIALVAGTIMWYQYDMANAADVGFEFINISPPIEQYSVTIFDHLVKRVPDLLTRLPDGLTDAVLLKFSFMVMEGCKDTIKFREIYYTFQEIILDRGKHAPTETNALRETIYCYAQIFDQSSGYEKSIARNLGIAHMALPHMTDLQVPIDTYITIMFDTGLYKNLVLTFEAIAIEQRHLYTATSMAVISEELVPTSPKLIPITPELIPKPIPAPAPGSYQELDSILERGLASR